MSPGREDELYDRASELKRQWDEDDLLPALPLPVPVPPPQQATTGKHAASDATPDPPAAPEEPPELPEWWFDFPPVISPPREPEPTSAVPPLPTVVTV
jgi:hypothetical protein